MGFDIVKTNLKPRHLLDLMEKQVKLPSASDVDNADKVELQEISKSMENLISQMSQMDDLFEHPLCELLGLDKQLMNIRGLVMEVAKKVQLGECIRK